MVIDKGHNSSEMISFRRWDVLFISFPSLVALVLLGFVLLPWFGPIVFVTNASGAPQIFGT